MKLSEFFSLLTYGELANLKIGGKDVGGIYPKYSDEVMSYVKQGLTALHSRFALKHSEVIIQQFSHISLYPLKYKYAVSNTTSTEIYKWIIDSEFKPFQEDILLIEEVFDEGGCRIPVNTDGICNSVYTPQSDVLQISNPNDENAISVIYKADHVPIDLSTTLPTETELEIPPHLIRHLTLYVSSLAHTAVGSPEGLNTGFAKMQEYEAACLQLEIQGTIHKEYWSDNIGGKGWV